MEDKKVTLLEDKFLSQKYGLLLEDNLKRIIKVIIGGLLIIIICIAGLYAYFFIYGEVVSPRAVSIESISVTDTMVTISGDDFADSALLFSRYNAKLEGGKLLIKLRYSLGSRFFPNRDKGFTIRYKTNKPIKEILILGNIKKDEKVIWTKEDPIKAYASYGGKSLHKQSHGESFLSLLHNRFGGNGIYLLDEPEAALSPQRQLVLLRIIRQLERNGKAQFLIATRSPILMAYPDADIYSFDQSPVATIKYEDAEHYQITRGFLNNRSKVLAELFSED